MFSPLNDPQVEEWFQRLNAPLQRLPLAERVELHTEVRQHLDALVAANKELGSPPEEAWELALTQFGDPTRIGRKMYREWQQSRTGFRADMKAILFGYGLQAIRGVVVQSLFPFWPQNGISPHPNPLLLWMLGFPMTVLISVVIGRKYPYHALKSALLWPFLWPIGTWVAIVTAHKMGWTPLTIIETLSVMLLHLITYNGSTILLSCAAAYLASVTKRGWYKPSLADFKLALPRKRPQTSR